MRKGSTVRQPLMVQHGLWLEDVVEFLRGLAEDDGDPNAARLLAEHDRLAGGDDRRRR